jgi:hypothetical protein
MLTCLKYWGAKKDRRKGLGATATAVEEHDPRPGMFSGPVIHALLPYVLGVQGGDSAPMAWNASFPDAALSSTQYAQNAVDPFAGSPFAVVATQPAAEGM